MTTNNPQLDYNSRLKPMEQKGKCGDPEYVSSPKILQTQLVELTEMVQRSKYTVVFTGAGISTSYPANIPDFRGPRGVWTRELKGDPLKPEEKNPKLFNHAQPTLCHNAIVQLINKGYVHHVVSQNVDGLHLRSGVPMDFLSEIHGNIFMEICEKCKRRYFRDYDVGGMGFQYTGNFCEASGCSGKLRDFAVDWDTDLPEDIMKRAKCEIEKADLVICLGTSLRIRPAGNMPAMVLKAQKSRNNKKGKLVIVNLQETHLDSKANLAIHHYTDDVMKMLCQNLKLSIDINYFGYTNAAFSLSSSSNTRSPPKRRMKNSNVSLPATTLSEGTTPDYFEEEEEENISKNAKKRPRISPQIEAFVDNCVKEARRENEATVPRLEFSYFMESPTNAQYDSNTHPNSTATNTLLSSSTTAASKDGHSYEKEKKEQEMTPSISLDLENKEQRKLWLEAEVGRLLNHEIVVNKIKFLKYFQWRKVIEDGADQASCHLLFEEYQATFPVGKDLEALVMKPEEYISHFEQIIQNLQLFISEYMELTMDQPQWFSDYMQVLSHKFSLENHLNDLKTFLFS